MFTERSAVLNKNVGTGGGHTAYLQIAEANMERIGWHLDRQVGRFVVAEDGTWLEKKKAGVGNEIYKLGGKNELGLMVYHCIREATNGSANYISGSKVKLQSFPGASVDFHSMVALPGDYVVLSDHHMERPKSKDTVVLVPTEDMVAPLQNRGYRATYAGWFVHPWTKDPEAVNECVRKIQRREQITVLIGLTGQTPKDHREIITSDIPEQAQMARDERVRFIYYTATNGEFGQELTQQLEEQRLNVCVNSQIFLTGAHAMVLWGKDFYEGNDLYWWALSQSHFRFRMPCESTPDAALRATADFPAKNGNAQGNADYLQEKRFSIPSSRVRQLGISGVLRYYLDDDCGETILDNMYWAQRGMNLNGGENLVAMLAEDPRVRHQLEYWK